MDYPLLDRELIAHLKLVHGSFNVAVMGLLLNQGRYGLQIRRARRDKTPLPLAAIRRHRTFGPLLALLGGAGFCAGLGLVLVDTGTVLTYPAHLLVGIAIVSLLFWTYRISREMGAGEIERRAMHWRLGVTILTLYLINVVLGIGALL